MKQALYIIPYPKFFSQHAGVGGHVAHAAGIISGLVEHGLNVKVVAEEYHDIFDIDGVSVGLLPCSSTNQLSRQFWSLRLLKHLRCLVKQQDFEFCYIRYSASFAPWLPLLKRIIGSVPLVLEVNSLGSQWRSLMRPVDKRALSAADRIICISQTLQDHILQLLDTQSEKSDVRLVINGVNVQRFEVVPAELGNSETTHAGFAGLLKADYGIETMIEAARLLRDENVMVHIFGDGPHRNQLEQMAENLNNIRFHGPIPFLQMPAYLKALDILVYTTDIKHLYQSPTKLFEYMAVGKPIVSAKTPQTGELLEEGETTLFYEVTDAGGMADAIRKLHQNAELREMLGMRAKHEAELKHAWSARIRQILA